MATELTVVQWCQILSDDEITNEFDVSMFQALYSFENYSAPSSEIGRLLGYDGKNPSAPLNSEGGRYAKRIAKKFDIEFTRRNSGKSQYWDLFFNGWQEEVFLFGNLRKTLF